VSAHLHALAPPGPPGRMLPGFSHINRYWDRTHGCYVAKILPGEFYVTPHDEAITTVLGSCVAACVRDPVNGIGGMNHFMLPEDSGDGRGGWHAADTSTAARYGNVAMEHLINEILKHGGLRRNLEVKVFGGGRIIPAMTDVGQRNIAFINDYIFTEGLRLVAEDVGETFPRKVLYYPLSGRARVKRLKSLHNDTLIQRERAYLQDLGQQPVAGDIELF